MIQPLVGAMKTLLPGRGLGPGLLPDMVYLSCWKETAGLILRRYSSGGDVVKANCRPVLPPATQARHMSNFHSAICHPYRSNNMAACSKDIWQLLELSGQKNTGQTRIGGHRSTLSSTCVMVGSYIAITFHDPLQFKLSLLVCTGYKGAVNFLTSWLAVESSSSNWATRSNATRNRSRTCKYKPIWS